MLGFGLVSSKIHANPLTHSDHQMMYRVVNDMPLSNEILDFVAKSRNSRFVFSNIENNKYTDEASPEYIIQDVLYDRLKTKLPNLRVLERDPDILRVLDDEMKGLRLPSESVEMKTVQKTTESTDVEARREHRDASAQLIEDVLSVLGSQDVIITNESSCCGDSDMKSEIVANEIGKTKKDLIVSMVEKHKELFPERNLKSSDKVTKKVVRKSSKVFLDQADYLFTYRVYDFGVWKHKLDRISYLKLHVRVVDMNTGQIIVSDFMEHKINDTAVDNIGKLVQGDYGRPASRTPKTGEKKGLFGLSLSNKGDESSETVQSKKSKRKKIAYKRFSTGKKLKLSAGGIGLPSAPSLVIPKTKNKSKKREEEEAEEGSKTI
jgi:uncharacterized protein YbbK (DUF523 family)